MRIALALFGILVLGISAGAAYRELTGTSEQASAPSNPNAARNNYNAASAGSTAVARMVPALRFVDGTGAPRTLADFRGRMILLNLWATWCVPCREEMPALDRVQQALGGPGFEVLALALDRGGIPAVQGFYKELDIRSLKPYVDQNGEALGKLGSVGIPLTMLIDRDGRELWRVVGPREWDKPTEMERIRGQLSAQLDR